MQRGRWRSRLSRRARKLKARVGALLVALRDPETPWYAKVCGIVVIAYAVSPLDVIPDFIPVIGMLDDLLLVPLGIFLTVRLIPRRVMLRALRRSWRMDRAETKRLRIAGVAIIILVWLVAALIVFGLLVH